MCTRADCCVVQGRRRDWVCQANCLPSLSLSFPICKMALHHLLQMVCWEDTVRKLQVTRTAACT